MARLVSLLVLVVAGWAAWSLVLQPALRPTAAPPPIVARVTVTPHPAAPPNQSGPAAASASRFFADWQASRYDRMYDQLAPVAQRAITRAAFVRRYSAIAAVAGLTAVRSRIGATTVHGTHAVVSYSVAMATSTVGNISFANHLGAAYTRGRWGIEWTPDLIFPGLGASFKVHLFAEPAERGSIVDRAGRPLAVQGSMMRVGVVPAYIHDEHRLLSFLSGWLHMPAAAIQARYKVAWAVQNPSEFVPVASVSSVQWNLVQAQALDQMNNGLDVVKGVSRRIYPDGTLAAPLLGYVTSDGGGGAGLERWADGYLVGKDGAKLAVANAPDFTYIASVIKERPRRDGATVHLTLDATLQAAAEKALAGKVGSVVALRPSDGAVLAMASVPGFDPNGFVNGLSVEQYRALIANPHQPLINRAATGQYPLGSIFKIVTMGAALEKAGYTPDTIKFCGGTWMGLGPAYVKHDWLPQGHGNISLHEALVQSCDIYFYQVGQQLNKMNHYLLPDYARAWGFDAPTGLAGVNEGSGVIPDPHWTLTTRGQPWVPGNAVDMAIGQGYVAVTPLQVAQMVAALGDGGVMHRPYVVRRVTGDRGVVIRDFPPTVTRRLPLSPAHRAAIVQAMLGVTTETMGTASDKFLGFRWPVAGKTGTAQTGEGHAPHAWFVALAPANHPRIALVVMVEHGGEGSQTAAPIARKILQTFFTKDADLAGTGTSHASGPAVLNVP